MRRPTSPSMGHTGFSSMTRVVVGHAAYAGLSSDAELCYNRRVISLVYLSNQAPSKLADRLTACGYQVWEALSVSEVLYLIEHEMVHAVVIAPEVEDKELVRVQLRNITIQLEQDAKIEDLVWELSNLFPTSSAAVQ